MKKIYKILLIIFGIEFMIASQLGKNDIQIQSKVGKTIGGFVFFLPIQILLYLLGKDNNISKAIKLLFKILFWHIKKQRYNKTRQTTWFAGFYMFIIFQIC